MRNPIHKRIERFETWQHLAFMLCICERMLPNFQLFCDVAYPKNDERSDNAKVLQNILNLVWEYLTIKGAKINFENQLQKLEEIIPDTNEFDFYGVFPAEDACKAVAELLHSIIAGEHLEQSILVSQISIATIISYLETLEDREFNEQELKALPEIEQELDLQWWVYRELKECEKRDVELLLELKNQLRESGISNIGLEFKQ
ncbi:DUF416 family protein [Pasteurella atlantica]|uniref:DUF416 family protein n=2 Tax=Pasteurellaceae TaxID=712 RepID=A0ACC6HNC0_9PAST|nr:DUF416 family protein [Pasteurella atlantica]MDP8034368.1 DUF416 family protein [Pasteurella atlantica]MDP8036323.1 DUF416 family protein [Pasteurella atlantica]MDP8038251.1 DUF416 family protein [Pasteurella atlantica]MDP8048604.1 DUF416 family protein [Pasteurella atlantica]MDP8050585.1 DUF416 family protein [Pasteurella atlantica]